MKFICGTCLAAGPRERASGTAGEYIMVSMYGTVYDERISNCIHAVNSIAIVVLRPRIYTFLTHGHVNKLLHTHVCVCVFVHFDLDNDFAQFTHHL